jgi:uncharacterized protein Usg
MALIVGVLYLAEHPRLLPRYRQQVMVLDSAFPDEVRLVAHLEGLLRGRVHHVTVQRVDLVNDTTHVDVRFELPRSGAAHPVPRQLVGQRDGSAR